MTLSTPFMTDISGTTARSANFPSSLDGRLPLTRYVSTAEFLFPLTSRDMDGYVTDGGSPG